ncbi:MAG: sensor histidine kinase [Candidatus Sericytochromatia bacterium]
MCVYPKDIQALFPEDQEAIDLGLDSYVGTPLFDTEGACLGLIAVMHTTPLASTEAAEALLRIVARRAEAEMQRLRTEERIARHLEELAEANRRLQEADRYKDEFLSVISHELRTPLNFITGFASTLDDEVQGPLNERQHDAMGKILNGAERMLMLIDDLLDFARMRAGRFDITPGPTDYKAVVDDVLMTMAPVAEQKGIRLSAAIEVPAGLQIDGRRLSQVLSNLVGNGLKFTPTGGQVTVRAAIRHGQLSTEVSDTGQGIAPDDLAKVFNRFEQLDMSNARAAGGVGLGLAIAQTIVEAHGGTIAVESRLKHGSTFRFTIPLTKALAALEESAP